MKRVAVEYNGKSVVLSEASTAMSIKRELLRSNSKVEGDIEQRIAGNMIYPDIMACVVGYEGFETWPPTPEEFANEWPARFADQLRDTAYELNPHWWPNYDEQEVKKKRSAIATRLLLTLSKIVNSELEAAQDKKDGFKAAPLDEVQLNNETVSMRIWKLMRFTEWRWLPDEILRQPEWLLDDLIAIDYQYNLVKQSLSK